MTLSNGSSLTEVLSVTVLGILIVFSVLVILMLVLNLMKLFAPKEAAKKEEKATEQTVALKDADEEELIAVLTAAVAASMKTSTYNLKIKSYKRL